MIHQDDPRSQPQITPLTSDPNNPFQQQQRVPTFSVSYSVECTDNNRSKQIPQAHTTADDTLGNIVNIANLTVNQFKQENQTFIFSSQDIKIRMVRTGQTDLIYDNGYLQGMLHAYGPLTSLSNLGKGTSVHLIVKVELKCVAEKTTSEPEPEAPKNVPVTTTVRFDNCPDKKVAPAPSVVGYKLDTPLSTIVQATEYLKTEWLAKANLKKEDVTISTKIRVAKGRDKMEAIDETTSSNSKLSDIADGKQMKMEVEVVITCSTIPEEQQETGYRVPVTFSFACETDKEGIATQRPTTEYKDQTITLGEIVLEITGKINKFVGDHSKFEITNKDPTIRVSGGKVGGPIQHKDVYEANNYLEGIVKTDDLAKVIKDLALPEPISIQVNANLKCEDKVPEPQKVPATGKIKVTIETKCMDDSAKGETVFKDETQDQIEYNGTKTLEEILNLFLTEYIKENFKLVNTSDIKELFIQKGETKINGYQQGAEKLFTFANPDYLGTMKLQEANDAHPADKLKIVFTYWPCIEKKEVEVEEVSVSITVYCKPDLVLEGLETAEAGFSKMFKGTLTLDEILTDVMNEEVKKKKLLTNARASYVGKLYVGEDMDIHKSKTEIVGQYKTIGKERILNTKLSDVDDGKFVTILFVYAPCVSEDVDPLVDLSLVNLEAVGQQPKENEEEEGGGDSPRFADSRSMLEDRVGQYGIRSPGVNFPERGIGSTAGGIRQSPPPHVSPQGFGYGYQSYQPLRQWSPT